MYLVTAREMQEMDRMTIESFGLPGCVLMENAGRGATQMLMNKFQDIRSKKVGIMAGRGNNGGDGFVIARYLYRYGIDTTVFLLSKKSSVKGDAKTNLNLLTSLGVPVIEIPSKSDFDINKDNLCRQDLWVDAILGTGLKSAVKGYFKTIISFINDSKLPVFSVDIPSGLDSDTGQTKGICVHATATATFAFAKPGHILYPGSKYTGRLGIVDIGIPKYIIEKSSPFQKLVTPEIVFNGYRPRQGDAHKGTAGHLMIIAGSPGKTGAAAMTATSAMKAGAGLVTLGVPASLNPILESQVLEVMTEPLAETRESMLSEASFDSIIRLLEGKQCLVIGPGLGMSEETGNLIRTIIAEVKIPVVVDADGINHIVGHTEILRKTKATVILTPHPGEMARLTGTAVKDVQNDRAGSARKFSKKYKVFMVLKGAKTVISNPDGSVFINPTGNPAMASGGMGDVLTGIIGGMLTQGYPPDYALTAGVFIHGAAADHITSKTGPVGILASEVMNAVPEQFSYIEQKVSSTYECVMPENLGL